MCMCRHSARDSEKLRWILRLFRQFLHIICGLVGCYSRGACSFVRVVKPLVLYEVVTHEPPVEGTKYRYLITREYKIVEQGNRCPAVPQVLPLNTRLDGGMEFSGIFLAFFGLEKAAKKQERYVHNTWARNNNNKCIWGRSEQ
ncbi:unnamed protein product [Laminaria digitata]